VPLEFRQGSSPRQTEHGPFLDIAQLNHYIVKSRSEFDEKKVRGGGWEKAGGERRRDRHNNAFFIEHDRNEVFDNLAASRVFEVRQETLLLRRKFLAMQGCDLAFTKLSDSTQQSAAQGSDESTGL
jgi:hypothetical protein